jgi:leucine dehydrogenase
VMGHEQVLLVNEPQSGYHAMIAIHSTLLGPAVGGTRMWRYERTDDALVDALRLSRGMTYKNAVAGLPLGGGKAVIMCGAEQLDVGRRAELFRAHGRTVERLGGRYITAEDVGTSTADMAVVRRETAHVAGLAHLSGDPSPMTARGVFVAMLAAARWRWGRESLARRVVALQGCGHVGYHLARELHRAGAELIAADVEPERLGRVAREFGATPVPPDAIFDVRADIFAPCALGGILDDRTIPRLTAEIVAGAANNQLLDESHGAALAERGILYAPDYVVNAGGVINGARELLGWEASRARAAVEAIYETTTTVFRLARAEGIPTNVAADRIADRRLAAARRNA